MKILKIASLALVLATACVGATSASADTADRNKDRIPDRWEHKYGLSLKIKQTYKDQDHDGLRNIAEYRAKTDPRKADTNQNKVIDSREDADRDGLTNATEDRLGKDPSKVDSDDDGTDDHSESVGTVTSIAGQDVTVTTADGQTVTAKVNSGTEIRCESVSASASRRSEDGGEPDDQKSGNEQQDNERSSSVSTPESSSASKTESEREGDDHSHSDGEKNGQNCDQSAITVGAVVREFELVVTTDGLVFHEIKLVK